MNQGPIERRFSRRLRAIRNALDLSMREVADISGVSTSTVSAVENGDRAITLQKAYDLAGAVGVELHDMIGESNIMVIHKEQAE